MSGYLCLTIEKMPQGGFVVFEGRSTIGIGDPNRLMGPLLASSTIGGALDFINNQMREPSREPLTADGKPTTFEAMDAAMRYEPNGARGALVGGQPIAGDPVPCDCVLCRPKAPDWAKRKEELIDRAGNWAGV